MSPSPSPHRARRILLGLVLPAVLVGGAAALVHSWLPRLPDPAVLHWGTDGPDRTGPFETLITTTVTLAALTWVPLAILVLVAARAEIARRVMVGAAALQGAVYAAVLLGSAWVQLDAPSAAAVSPSTTPLLVLLLAALALGVGAGLLAGPDPHAPAADPVPDDATRIDLPPGARAVWVDRCTVRHQWLWWTVLALWLGVTVAFTYLSAQWWLLAVLLLPALVLLANLHWTLRVDSEGLHARALFGWPRLTVRADETQRADVITVQPFAEFGGWGMRSRPDGTSGLVLRSGEAVQVQTSGDRTYVITTDDAERAAALLNTMADRSRGQAVD
ncbi:MAG TPA: hypothetical protein VK060_04675 [Ruania sp.]|nr:hypothetical protein [Ruania sp.]